MHAAAAYVTELVRANKLQVKKGNLLEETEEVEGTQSKFGRHEQL